MQTADDIRQLQEQIAHTASFTDRINQQLHKIIIGQQDMIDRLLTGLLCNGHILLEGVPGLAKTLAIKSLSQALSVAFSRIQFTVSPSMVSANNSGFMLKPVLNISGSTTTCVGTWMPPIFSSSICRLAALSSQCR